MTTDNKGDIKMDTAEMNEISINGINYLRKDSVQPKLNGKRAVVVVDRGWIFAGDVTEENGRIYLDRAVWVFRWESVGFAAVVADPKKSSRKKALPRVFSRHEDCARLRATLGRRRALPPVHAPAGRWPGDPGHAPGAHRLF